MDGAWRRLRMSSTGQNRSSGISGSLAQAVVGKSAPILCPRVPAHLTPHTIDETRKDDDRDGVADLRSAAWRTLLSSILQRVASRQPYIYFVSRLGIPTREQDQRPVHIQIGIGAFEFAAKITEKEISFPIL